MIKAIFCVLALSGCSATTAAMTLDDGRCTVNERAKLSGLKTGAAIVTPSAEVQAQIAELEAECAP